MYACGAPRTVNDKLEPLESALDYSEFFTNPGSLKDEIQAIWKYGGEISQVDRLGGELTETSIRDLIEKLTSGELDVLELLTSEVRPHFHHLQKNAVTPLNDKEREAIEILKLYKEQYDLVVYGSLETPSYHLERHLIDPNPNESNLIQYKRDQKKILFGPVMMDLYA